MVSVMSATTIGLSLDRAAIGLLASRFRWAATSSGGVSAIHWFSEMSAKRSLRNISRKRSGSSPVFST